MAQFENIGDDYIKGMVQMSVDCYELSGRTQIIHFTALIDTVGYENVAKFLDPEILKLCDVALQEEKNNQPPV